MKCRVPWCTADASPFPSRKGYCEKHRRQIERKGYVYKSYTEPNEFIIEGNICKIILKNMKSEIVAYAIIDIEDMDKCRQHHWSAVAKGRTIYVRSSKLLYLHHLILGYPPEGMGIDHKDMEGLNNRRNNLRFCTNGQNKANRTAGKNNTSGYKGVAWDKRSGKWQVQVGNSFYVGTYANIIEAAIAYDTKAVEVYGEFARTNF